MEYLPLLHIPSALGPGRWKFFMDCISGLPYSLPSNWIQSIGSTSKRNRQKVRPRYFFPESFPAGSLEFGYILQLGAQLLSVSSCKHREGFRRTLPDSGTVIWQEEARLLLNAAMGWSDRKPGVLTRGHPCMCVRKEVMHSWWTGEERTVGVASRGVGKPREGWLIKCINSRHLWRLHRIRKGEFVGAPSFMCITEKPVSRDRKGNQLEIYKIGVCRM